VRPPISTTTRYPSTSQTSPKSDPVNDGAWKYLDETYELLY
jgi:hypothetical protein